MALLLRCPIVLLIIFFAVVLWLRSNDPGSDESMNQPVEVKQLRLRRTDSTASSGPVLLGRELISQAASLPRNDSTSAEAIPLAVQPLLQDQPSEIDVYYRPKPNNRAVRRTMSDDPRLTNQRVRSAASNRLPSIDRVKEPAATKRAKKSSSTALSKAKVHRVVNGDRLDHLAAQYLGSAGSYLEIFEANRDVLARPDVLPLGVELRIPQ